MSKNQMAMAVSGVPQRENKIHPRAQKRAEVWARTSQKSRDLSKKSMTLSRLIDVGARRQHEDRMRITPGLAAEMLTYNTKNRPISRVKVDHWAREMTSGKWEGALTTIIFSDAGNLLDGQHRLEAIIKAEVTVDNALVRFGLPANSFDKIDVGLKRTNADIFAINGCPHAHVAAAASKWIHMYRSEARLSPQTMSPTLIEKSVLYDFYTTLDNFALSVPYAHLFMHNRVPTPSIATAAHYLFAEYSRAQADIYMTRIATGADCPAGTPALKVRNRLIQERLAAKDVLSCLIVGWNAHRTNKSRVTIPNLGTRSALPRIVK